jgi:Glycosyl hydrolases family 25
MTDIRFADCSEWQSNIDFDTYLGSGHTVIILRAHSGYHPDRYISSRMAAVRARPFVAVGYYQYMVQGRDAAQQAREFIATLGSLRPNEFAICDSEEGAGDQTGRVQAWFNVVDPWAGCPSHIYASQSWYYDHLGGVDHWHPHPIWMAAYSSREPTAPHAYWQYTDASHLPGISGDGGDGNIYHGTDTQFLAMARSGHGGLPPTPEDTVAISATQNHDGRLEVFVELQSGEVKHTWQTVAGGGWAGAEAGKAVCAWYSMGKVA